MRSIKIINIVVLAVVLFGLLFLPFLAFSQTTVQPIANGKLIDSLDANSQDILATSGITVGPTAQVTAATAREALIHLFPTTGYPADGGIKIGTGASAVTLYRSASGVVTLTGNLIVTGTITGTGNPVRVEDVNTWTAANTWTASSTFQGVANFGDLGLTITSTGASVARSALGLVLGTDVAAYSARLNDIATAGTALADNFIIGNGSNWLRRTPAEARAALDLSSSDSPSFSGLTLSGSATGTAVTLSGLMVLTGAVDNATGLRLGNGTARLYTDNTSLITDQSFVVGGNTQLGNIADGDTLTDTINVRGLVTFGSGSDVNLYRNAANQLKTDDTFVAAALQLGTPLPLLYGGIGINASTLASGDTLYYNGTAMAAVATTSTGRSLMGVAGASGARVLLELGGAALLSVGTTTGTVAAGDDSRFTNSRAPTGSAAGGDILGTYPTNLTLAASGVTLGSYGSATAIPVLTIDAKGRVTVASSVTIQNVQTSASPTFVGLTLTGNALVAGHIKSSSPTAGIGYGAGAGVSEVQPTSATTSVTANGMSGQIALHATQNVAAGAEQSFTMVNSSIEANDVVTVHRKGGTATATPFFFVGSITAGSCVITMTNLHAATAETGADLTISFSIIKGSSN